MVRYDHVVHREGKPFIGGLGQLDSGVSASHRSAQLNKNTQLEESSALFLKFSDLF